MEFAIGVLTGMTIAALIATIMIFLRVPIEKNVKIVQRKIEAVGPKPIGFIVEPDSEITEARQRLTEKSKREGKDTNLTDL